MNKNFILHQAKSEDLEMIEGLLKETALWLKAKGSLQWNGILDGKDNHDTASAILRGEVFYGTVDNELAGMFILWDCQSKWDVTLWGADSSNDFYYLHRLNIKRNKSGMGIPHLMIDAAKEYAKQERKKALRLDCIAENRFLNQMYQQEKFDFIDCVKDVNAGEQINDFNLYQYVIK